MARDLAEFHPDGQQTCHQRLGGQEVVEWKHLRPSGSAIASIRRRTSCTVGGSGLRRDPPFTGVFFAGGRANHDQEGVGDEAEGYVAVPSIPQGG